MPLVPEYIGPYRVLHPIAAGGMAEVYEVEDPASGERLALKLLVAVHAALRRFDREYESMTRLNHPGIVRVYHYGLHQGHPWLTMELLRGVAAQSFIKRVGRPGTPQRLREVLRVGYHVASALQYVHDRGLVHRDLKSANVLVLPDDRIKLLDFGAAHLIDGQRITEEGEFVGTFAYASPEQILGRSIDFRSDLYSFGVLLFRLATGHRPFRSTEVETLVHDHLHVPPPDPREIVPGLPADFAVLIESLLSKRPEDRPSSAQHVAASLEEIHGRPFSSRSRLAVHDPSSAPRGAERLEAWEHLEEGPDASLLLVDGDAGSDRIRFLDSLHREATERGWAAYRCTLGRGVSLERLVRVLVALGEDCDHRDAPHLIDTIERCATPQGLVHPPDRAALRQSVVSLARIRAAEAEHPTLLVVQEAHRADPQTLELLGGLRRALQGQPVPFKLVISCLRSSIPDISWRLGEARRFHLAPLSPRQIAVAVGNMLGRRPPPAELSRRLHAATDGQPLYLEQAVRLMIAGEGLQADDHRLAWTRGNEPIPPPEGVIRAARRTLAGLPVLSRRLIEAVAIAQDATHPTLLAQVMDWDEIEVISILDGLESQGVLFWDPDQGQIHWRQPILARLVRDEIHPSRRAMLCRRMALLELPTGAGAVTVLLQTRRLDDAAAVATEIAAEMMGTHQVRTALEHMAPVVEAVRDTGSSRAVADLLFQYAVCLRRIRPTDPDNNRLLARVRELGRHDESMLVQVDLAQARQYKAIGHYANYLRYLQQGWARPLARERPRLGASLATELSRCHRWRGEIGQAEAWVENALTAAEGSGDLSLLGDAIVESAACMLARGHIVDSEQAYTLAMQDYERVSDRHGYWRALARWTSVLRIQGRYSDALTELYQRLPEASQSQDPAPYVELLQAAAWVELDLSRLGRAQEYTDELTAALGRGEHLHLRLNTEILHGRILLASGQLRAAEYCLRNAQRMASNADLPVLSELARSTLAETVHLLGDRRAAASLFQSAILGLMAAGDATVLAEGVRARARRQATEHDPRDIFRPVDRMIAEQPMILLKLEQLLARGIWNRRCGENEASRMAFREAAMVLNILATSLHDTDRAALRVHPWSTRIRKGLRQDVR